MKRYQCSDFESSDRRPWGPPPCPPTGPWTGPCQPACNGGCVPTPWVLGGSYRAGQLVTHEGYLYVANVDNAAGVPGKSRDFTLLSTLQPIGPTGPAGPAGPAGAMGCPGPAGPTGATAAGRDGQQRRGKPRKQGEFGALLMQNIPYNILTLLCAFLWGPRGIYLEGDMGETGRQLVSCVYDHFFLRVSAS